MIFRLFLLFVLLAPLWAYDSLLKTKIDALVDDQNLKTHKKLLDVLFQYEDEFVDSDGNVDIIKVVKVLKENGLLKIFFDNPVTLKAKFVSDMYPLFLMKAISDSLNKLGYHYILTHELLRDQNRTDWTIIYNSEHAIDPLSLSEELGKYHIRIDTIVNNETLWEYFLTSNDPVLLDTQQLLIDNNMTAFNDPRGEYWFQVEENATQAHIKSQYPDLWYPYIICYNKDLNILKIYKRDRSTRSLKLRLPQATKYLKLTDMFTSENLKHGIEIQIEGAD